jgi:hypothetical protein
MKSAGAKLFEEGGMGKPNKDSSETFEFMKLFADLIDWSDDRPEELVEFAANDQSVKDLCIKLSFAAFELKMSERRTRELFAAPVDPSFQAAWRVYEERYDAAVSDVWLGEILREFEPSERDRVSKADLDWENADFEGRNKASHIELVFDFAQFNIDQDGSWGDQTGYVEDVKRGISDWEQFKLDTGIDLARIIRRRELVPFVLVPRKVSANHGGSESLSILKSLQQAHDAFIYGANFAALALMRSIMEAVLRDHYQADGERLDDRIHSARKRLPPAASEAALHRLRKLANAVLHLDHGKDQGLARFDEVRLEKEIVSLLFVLRALIEGVK